MPSFFIVPFILAVDHELGMEDRLELKAVDYLALHVGMQRFDVGIVEWRGYMRELVVNIFFFKLFSYDFKIQCLLASRYLLQRNHGNRATFFRDLRTIYRQ